MSLKYWKTVSKGTNSGFGSLKNATYKRSRKIIKKTIIVLS